MSKCETCKWKNAEDGWAVCDGCIHAPDLEDKYKPLTNADHIRAMMDYDLADFLIDWEDSPKASGHDGFTSVLRWLQQPDESPTVEKG